MKKLFLLAIGLASVCLTAKAVLPTFRTFSGYGNATTPAQIIMPADPNSQIRIVSLYYTSDTNIAGISFSTGVGAYYQANTNALTSSITNWVNTTNGLVPTSTLVLQQNGQTYTNALVSFGSFITGTNSFGVVTNQAFVVLGTGGWGTNALVGADIFQMGSASTIYVGAGTNALNGDAIYVGNYGRPVIATLSPALSTNRIPSLSTHYDSQTY